MLQHIICYLVLATMIVLVSTVVVIVIVFENATLIKMIFLDMIIYDNTVNFDH